MVGGRSAALPLLRLSRSREPPCMFEAPGKSVGPIGLEAARSLDAGHFDRRVKSEQLPEP